MQRFGGDASARKKLRAERKRLRSALQGLDAEDPAERRTALTTELDAVKEALTANRTTIHFTEPKSARSRRTVALPAVAVAALKIHRVRQLEMRLAAGGAWREMGLVFASSVGTPLDGRNVSRQFKELLKDAGLRMMRLHDLRHSCATLLLVQGVNPRVVMETLGHSQVSLTLNTYSHVVPALQRDAAAKMDAILSGSSAG